MKNQSSTRPRGSMLIRNRGGAPPGDRSSDSRAGRISPRARGSGAYGCAAAVLPDGSRSLIPASWTDWKALEVTDEPSRSDFEHREPCLAPLTDLLHARAIVDALLGRCLIPQSEPAADEESCHATDPGRYRTSRSCTTAAEPSTRRQSTRRGSRHSGTHHRASLRGNQ